MKAQIVNLLKNVNSLEPLEIEIQAQYNENTHKWRHVIRKGPFGIVAFQVHSDSCPATMLT